MLSLRRGIGYGRGHFHVATALPSPSLLYLSLHPFLLPSCLLAESPSILAGTGIQLAAGGQSRPFRQQDGPLYWCNMPYSMFVAVHMLIPPAKASIGMGCPTGAK